MHVWGTEQYQENQRDWSRLKERDVVKQKPWKFMDSQTWLDSLSLQIIF